MAQSKRFRRLGKALKRYGLEIRSGKNHQGIYKGERRIYTFASTPTNLHFAEHNTFHDLKKMGHIPKEDKSL